MRAEVYDGRCCTLGEGPLWHPSRYQLFWFDIVNCRLLSQAEGTPLEWEFDRNVSAAGWIDNDRLLVASETGLSRFDLATGTEDMLCPIEADRTDTRSNDGRADPWGGFWIGTMGKAGEPGMGSLYRWWRGELRVLERALTTPNAICFDQSRLMAYFADTRRRLVWRQALDPSSGWPAGEKEIFLNLAATTDSPEYKPDGAIVDADGCVWIAQWGAARVARYDPAGSFLEEISLPTGHTSCPAFGGADLSTLFVTTATQKLPEIEAWRASAGKTFRIPTRHRGVAEPAVIL